MGMIPFRWWLYFMLALLCIGSGRASQLPEPLDDCELGSIYATGLNIKIDLDFDLTVPQPGTLFIGQDQLQALQHLAETGLQRTSIFEPTTGGTFDADGIALPNFEALVNNTITNQIAVTDNALQNATSLLNIFATGDVAVGLNLVIIVNPGDTPFTVTQTNINWSDLLSSITPTPTIP